MSAKAMVDTPKLWLLDSGASYHMIKMSNVVNHSLRLRPASNVVNVQTANGIKVLDSDMVQLGNQ